MKINKEYRIEKVCAKESTKYALSSVWFDATKQQLTASDGRGLVQIPCEAELEDKSFLIPAEAFKIRPKGDDVCIQQAEDVAIAYVGEAEHHYPIDDLTFPPDIGHNFKDESDDDTVVSFSPELLMNIAQAMNATDVVTLRIPKTGKPIMITAPRSDPGCRASLMPYNFGEQKKEEDERSLI